MAGTKEVIAEHNRIQLLHVEIAAETGIHYSLVNNIHSFISNNLKNGVTLNSKNVVRCILTELINLERRSLQRLLEHNGIYSSDDIGKVVQQLCKKGLLVQEGDDDFEDFNGLFTTATLHEYIKLHKIKRVRHWYETVGLSLLIVSLLLVVLSHFTFISKTIGWCALGCVFFGWLLYINKMDLIIELRNKVFGNK